MSIDFEVPADWLNQRVVISLPIPLHAPNNQVGFPEQIVTLLADLRGAILVRDERNNQICWPKNQIRTIYKTSEITVLS
jgi:hypothetical protein